MKIRVVLDVEVEDEDGQIYDDVETWDWVELIGPGTVFVSAEEPA